MTDLFRAIASMEAAGHTKTPVNNSVLRMLIQSSESQMSIAEQIEMPSHVAKRIRKKAGSRRVYAEAGGSFPDIIYSLEDRFTPRQKLAAAYFVRDIQAPWGTSGGLVGSVQERVDTSFIYRGNMVGWTFAHGRFEGLNKELRWWEHQLLHFLIRNQEYARRRLADYARPMVNYKNDSDLHAYTVGKIAALLDSIADYYRLPPQ